MDKLSGLILDSSEDTSVNANKELDELVDDLFLILKIKGQSQPYAFSLMENSYLRNLILANIADEEPQAD